MLTAMTTDIVGASVWEQRLYDHVVGHVEAERDVLVAYEAVAADTTSPPVRYLIGLLLDDERRHHEMLRQLAETIRTTAELSGEPTPIPHLAPVGKERLRILDATERFLAVERDDRQELAKLAKELRPVRNTTLWHLVVELLQRDNEKHTRVLQFIRDWARASQ